MKPEHNKDFFKAAKIIDENKSGSGQDWYRPGSLHVETDEKGKYKPYIESVVKETEERFPELNKKVQEIEKAQASATYGLEKIKTQEEKDKEHEEEI